MGNDVSPEKIARLKADNHLTPIQESDYIAQIVSDPAVQKNWIDNFRVVVCGQEPSPEMAQLIEKSITMETPGSHETVEHYLSRFKDNPDWIDVYRNESRESGLNLSCTPPKPVSLNYPAMPVKIASSGFPGKQRG